MKEVDMSAQAVTNRMIALDQLWELAVALKSSKIIDDGISDRDDTTKLRATDLRESISSLERPNG